jgi:hypothetical protein
MIILLNILFAQQETSKMVSDATFDSLKQNAAAVILEDIHIIMVEDDEIEYQLKRKVLINNKDGRKYGEVFMHESEFYSVDDIESVLKDTQGNTIKELNEDDIIEITYSSGYTEKMKAFRIFTDTYPVVMEYSYTYTYKSHFFWPDWYPQSGIPVLSSTYKIILYNDVPYKTFKIGTNVQAKILKEKGEHVHLYALKNIPPLKKEDYLPMQHKVQNAILFAPLKFSLGRSHGSFESWDDVAGWYRSLARDRYRIPENLKQEIQSLISEITDPYEKIDILYKYLQDKTRYVQIYLDIGGWQPHPAEWVYNNRFGDCKDLSTLMISILDAAGIKSYPALVLTKDNGYVYPEFPSNQFNHAIAFVPLANDTLWLECTADFIAYKDVPYNIEGSNALLVKENSGEILKINQRKGNENLLNSVYRGKLNPRGTLTIEGSVISTGSLKNYYKIKFATLKSEELKNELHRDFSVYQPNFSLKDYSITQEKSTEPLKINFSGEYNRFAQNVGSRLFLNPNILNRETHNYIPEEIERIYPVNMVKYPYLNMDSLEIALPKNYTIESAPERKNLVHSFGKFITDYKVEDGIFYYKRHFEYSKDLIEPQEFNEFLDFYKTVVETDKTRFIFKEQ